MSRNTKRLGTLAASLVVTVGFAPGCKPKGSCAPPDCHINPPPPEVTVPPPASVTVPSASASGMATLAIPEVSASASAIATVATAQPPASSSAVATATGSTRPQRICYAKVESHCPPYDPQHPRTCNPPAPRQVPCGTVDPL